MLALNKGIGKGPEFRGLKGKWMYLMAGGLVLILLGSLALQLSGVNPYLGVVLSGTVAGAFIQYIFRSNARYGEHGLAKQMASRQRPRYLVIRRPRVFTL
ncbi:MAG: DUF4133 domain-containing protein [Bacteroidia bacterium]|nr:DUF4133 domain-containing protein [Bacteroidia bacterium]